MSGVFEGAGAPPPPPGEPAVASTPPLPATPLGRFAFRALIPSLLLPALVTLCGLLGAIGVGRSGPGWNIDWLVIGAFCLVLNGSMGLNAWLLLRHPQSWLARAFPTGVSVALAVLWGLLVVGAVLVALTTLNLGTMALAIAVMIASIVVFIAALVRKLVRVAVVPVVAVRVSRYWAVTGWTYLVLVAVTIVTGVVLAFSLGPTAVLVLFVPVGVPWAPPIALLGFILGASASTAIVIVAAVLILAGIALNVVVVLRLLTNAAFRVRFVNWFFKLRGGTRSGDADGPTAIRTFAPPQE